MSTRTKAMLVSALVLLSGQSSAANLTITINNDTSRNLLVTVYDMSMQPPLTILSSALINGNGSITVSVSLGPRGQGSIAWTAVTMDQDMRGCGQGSQSGLNDRDSVDVNAESDCS